ncbi:UbiA family prenyltransferase [Methanosphaerula palustris]|uniref:UbiA prenyltransferase n=1 Tax=Methanosphaerula palustris (strain ATCC BAA-1556 / DSM 19958 / E1-9c) TaxID=521011 RepID=B8GEL3_METPE|nr:UbiA family prenyltransferase [Methanosphaerula palustris]ACL17714.1 UbiA prenyltransferase [Methanosphaerula palustris E1-9c]
MTPFATPTMRLLNSSTVVALSGGLRLHIAFLLAGLAMRIPVYCACILIIYSTYTLDRALDCKEDAINKSELCGANRNAGLIASAVTFLLGASILGMDGIYLAPLFPFIVGYFYTRGIRIGSHTIKLKGSVGVKNIIVGITWGGTIALIISQWTTSLVTVGIIFLFYGSRVFVNSCVNDFKDVKGDMMAGIRTLPACLGENMTRGVLILILLGLYGVMIYALNLHIIRSEWIILLFSLVVTIAFLMVYSSSFEDRPSLIFRKMREFVISWEPIIGLTIRACVVG